MPLWNVISISHTTLEYDIDITINHKCYVIQCNHSIIKTSNRLNKQLRLASLCGVMTSIFKFKSIFFILKMLVITPNSGALIIKLPSLCGVMTSIYKYKKIFIYKNAGHNSEYNPDLFIF